MIPVNLYDRDSGLQMTFKNTECPSDLEVCMCGVSESTDDDDCFYFY